MLSSATRGTVGLLAELPSPVPDSERCNLERGCQQVNVASLIRVLEKATLSSSFSPRSRDISSNSVATHPLTEFVSTTIPVRGMWVHLPWSNSDMHDPLTIMLKPAILRFRCPLAYSGTPFPGLVTVNAR